MTELKIALEFGECNGYMSTQIYINDTLIASPTVTDSKDVVVDTNVEFPFDLTIKVDGKNSNVDTLVEDGKIVKDKYVSIKKIYLARFNINESVMYNLCRFTPTGGEEEKTTYLYRNGNAVLQFRAQDALRWHLMHNKY